MFHSRHVSAPVSAVLTCDSSPAVTGQNNTFVVVDAPKTRIARISNFLVGARSPVAQYAAAGGALDSTLPPYLSIVVFQANFRPGYIQQLFGDWATMWGTGQAQLARPDGTSETWNATSLDNAGVGGTYFDVQPLSIMKMGASYGDSGRSDAYQLRFFAGVGLGPTSQEYSQSTCPANVASRGSLITGFPAASYSGTYGLTQTSVRPHFYPEFPHIVVMLSISFFGVSGGAGAAVSLYADAFVSFDVEWDDRDI